jgi:hypothetical protein
LCVIGWNRVVDVDEDARFLTHTFSFPPFTKACGAITYLPGIHARDRYQWPRSPAASTSDLNLPARDIELRSAKGLRDMQRNGLHADEVLSRREVSRDGESDGREIWV